MANKYTWLYNNLEKYHFNTDEAKSLYEEFKALNIDDNFQSDDKIIAKADNCYNRFIKMFNNNPFCYKNGLEEFGIETDELDCYFIDNNTELVPIGYYKALRPVESVFLINRKIEEQKNRTNDIKSRLLGYFKRETQVVDFGYHKFNKEKKANYVRAVLATISSLFIVWFFISFLKITNIFEILKCIGNKHLFSDAIKYGMSMMPIFSNWGVAGWFFLLIVHIILLIIVIRNVKGIVNEYILTYKKGVTTRFIKKTQNDMEKINANFNENLENDAQEWLALSRKGKSTRIEKRNLARIIKKIRKSSEIAREYINKSFNDIIGIRKNKTIVFMVIIAVVGSFIYGVLAKPQIKANIDAKTHEMRVKMDSTFLRSQKMKVVYVENCQLFKSAGWDSKIKRDLPIWSLVELVDTKTIYEEEWSKIKMITDTEILTGWVPSAYLLSDNTVDYNLFSEITVIGSSASSYLEGENEHFVPENAYDWNNMTSWQDGNIYSSGDGEYITLNFAEKTRVDMIQIFPGSAKDEASYYRNERIKKAKISFSNGKSVTYEFDDIFSDVLQTIRLNKPVETDYITIEILEVYNSIGEDSCLDLAISEIHAYQRSVFS